MKFHLPLRLVGPSLAVTLLVLTSCGSADSNNAAGSDQDPLSEALGLPADEDFFSEESQIETEERIAACMKKAGFEYVPNISTDFVDSFEDYGTPEWAEEWGFGISTQFFSQTTVGPNLKGYDDSASEDIYEDPNTKIRDALSPEDLMAYEEALYGHSFSDDGDLSDEEFEEIITDNPGCINSSLAESESIKFFEEYEDELEEAFTRYEADPRVAEAKEDFVKCIKDKGYEFEGEQEFSDATYKKMEETFPSVGGIEEVPVEPGEDEETAAEPGDEGDFEDYEEPELTDDQKAKLGEIQTEEIATAMAAHECGLHEGEYADRIKELENEHLQEFVDANKEGIEKYKQ